MSYFRLEAIANIHINAITVDETTGAFDEDGNQIVIDEAAVATEIARLEAEYASKQYQRNRAKEYPPLEEQLDYIYHNGVEAWKTDMIQPVKDKYPKPTE
jgi:hypothetical protein